jgi:formate/nitrite transporter FocA (FNT family)
VPAFILAGFEHCVADIFYLAAAWKHGLGFDANQLLFLLMVILGNSAGALIMNALVPQPTPKTT